MLQKNKKVAVFGGTFDPPHKGHSFLVKKIIADKYADEIIFIPALNPPHKQGLPSASFIDRVEMIRIVTKKMNMEMGNFCSLSNIEGERKDKPSYTYDTMIELGEKFPEYNFVIIIGEDSLLHIHTWYKAEELIKNWKIITYPRNCYNHTKKEIIDELKKKWPENIAYLLFESILSYELYNISSTEIRDKIADQKDVSELIYPEIYKYIKEKGLYKRG